MESWKADRSRSRLISTWTDSPATGGVPLDRSAGSGTARLCLGVEGLEQDRVGTDEALRLHDPGVALEESEELRP